MEIELVKWFTKPSRKVVGSILVKYGEMLLRLEVLVYRNIHLWVKMPELKYDTDKILKLCYWPDKETSDAFQKEVLRQLMEQYGEEVDEAWKGLKGPSRKPREILVDKI